MGRRASARCADPARRWLDLGQTDRDGRGAFGPAPFFLGEAEAAIGGEHTVKLARYSG